MDAAQHRELAVRLFNRTWELIEQTERTAEQVDEMVHGAHASRYHWGFVGTAKNFAIGEWQISRVYAVLGRPEPALFHGRRCLELCAQNDLAPFETAYAHEAIARALLLLEDSEWRHHQQEAQKLALLVEDEEDRRYLLADLATLKQHV